MSAKVPVWPVRQIRLLTFAICGEVKYQLTAIRKRRDVHLRLAISRRWRWWGKIATTALIPVVCLGQSAVMEGARRGLLNALSRNIIGLPMPAARSCALKRATGNYMHMSSPRKKMASGSREHLPLGLPVRSQLMPCVALVCTVSLAYALAPNSSFVPIASACGPTTANITCIHRYGSVLPPSFWRDSDPNVGYSGTLVPDDPSWAALVPTADFLPCSFRSSIPSSQRRMGPLGTSLILPST
ncbi:predicted protein [Plenodomus lingam JN3]|uniref:Predicted protein n=1 Tax=Leptosphaeria maculans (strain JN3 / isolate v23.1.3 / race Av1-4-5-6-7-8) TaxID=985895 RepID=E5AE32_LEPMJ|nr:predicted protein [Plenodomus lingam JN3]CBY01471.1 predicted protein [Plenodomus lingam JN3]